MFGSETTPIEDLIIIYPTIFEDERGIFYQNR
jgi:dTDP-4-dehydrorhamnose 3,5-epimerase-like enzyme